MIVLASLGECAIRVRAIEVLLYIVLKFTKIAFIYAASADYDEMPHYVTSHLRQHCFVKTSTNRFPINERLNQISLVKTILYSLYHTSSSNVIRNPILLY